ncbi:putative capping alpha-like subunit [Toxoplasma gondii TgCatPRC2]|uniref:Putative capping alpha-like subunit n=1 Tax=Toxoplasma gondii TgCatPRC2 TaxID=1130821 RepID=A0A151HGP5_TOXGO|nr:putative capping alpha-like subunit [Toxoplasma gondii TgCatPRC2]
MEDAANGDSQLSAGVDAPRSNVEEDSGDAETLAKTRCIVRFFANNSPPDQLKSVVEDCEMLAADGNLMDYDFLEGVLETAHDETLALFAFAPGEGQPVVQGIMCREGKLGDNVYLYPPAKLTVTISHSTCALLLPPRPASPSCFPEELEPYRQALEDTFSCYVGLRYSDDSVEPRRSAVRTRHASAVYSRVLSENEKETTEASDASSSGESDTYVPPQSSSAVAFVKEGGGKVYKLTAAMSLRHSNAESCWAAARTSYWEVYFSVATQRLVIEGEVRLHSHTCEDWNAQVDYRRRFVSREAAAGKGETVGTDNSEEREQKNGNDTPQTAEHLPPEARAKGVSEKHGKRVADWQEGLYVENCRDVEDPTALARHVIEFIKTKETEVLSDEKHYFHVYVPDTLRSLRRVLSLTGRSFDWQQQSLQL